MGYLTEKETLDSQLQNLFLLDKLLRKDGAELKDLVNEIPGIFHTNRRDDMTIDNLNSEGEEYCELSKDEINKMGMEYFSKYAHPYTINIVGPRFQKFYDKADDEKVKGDFQLIKNIRTGVFDVFFTVSKPYKKQGVLLTSTNTIQNLEWANQKIRRIAGEEIFVRQNFGQFQNLTDRELEILKLIASGDTNSRISDKLFISIETVKQHRKNIKKKTECKNTVALVRFAQAFDLV
jgi:DNA-binding CsgD family transcriptional regulator